MRRVREDADKRDDQADARDEVAEQRETTEDLTNFLASGEYGEDLDSRRATVMDRQDSKQDRESAAADRDELADEATTSEEKGSED